MAKTFTAEEETIRRGDAKTYTVDHIRRLILQVGWPTLFRLIKTKKHPLPFTMSRRGLNTWLKQHTVRARPQKKRR